MGGVLLRPGFPSRVCATCRRRRRTDSVLYSFEDRDEESRFAQSRFVSNHGRLGTPDSSSRLSSRDPFPYLHLSVFTLEGEKLQRETVRDSKIKRLQSREGYPSLLHLSVHPDHGTGLVLVCEGHIPSSTPTGTLESRSVPGKTARRRRGIGRRPP